MAQDAAAARPGAKSHKHNEGNAAIVLCGTDAVALGVAASDLAARGRRVAVWLGEPNADAIVEMVDELFVSESKPPLR